MRNQTGAIYIHTQIIQSSCCTNQSLPIFYRSETSGERGKETQFVREKRNSCWAEREGEGGSVRWWRRWTGRVVWERVRNGSRFVNGEQYAPSSSSSPPLLVAPFSTASTPARAHFHTRSLSLYQALTYWLNPPLEWGGKGGRERVMRREQRQREATSELMKGAVRRDLGRDWREQVDLRNCMHIIKNEGVLIKYGMLCSEQNK